MPFFRVALVVLATFLHSLAATAAELQVTADASTYNVGGTITITVVGSAIYDCVTGSGNDHALEVGGSLGWDSSLVTNSGIFNTGDPLTGCEAFGIMWTADGQNATCGGILGDNCRAFDYLNGLSGLGFGIANSPLTFSQMTFTADAPGEASFDWTALSFYDHQGAQPGVTVTIIAPLTLTDTTNVSLAAIQLESGGNTTENPDVTGGDGGLIPGTLIPYTETGSFTCCGASFLGDNLDDGDVGAGVASDGTYAIPDAGTLLLDFGSAQTITSVAIYDGYTNRDDGAYTLRDDAANVLGAWTITTFVGSSNDGAVSFWLTFDTPVKTSSLTLELAPDENATASFREIQVMARPRIIDDTNITLAATQIETGPDTTENPDVTGGMGGALIQYTASGSFTCCGAPFLADNLDDGDVGAGIPSDGTYAIPDSGTLLLDFGSPRTLASIAIYNGYTNRDDGTYTLRDDASNVLGIWTIATAEGADNNDGVDSFWLTFDTPVTTSSLTLEIASTDEDGTASFREIQVFGGPASVPVMDARGHALTVGVLLLVAVSMLRRQRTEAA
jgi:hypothetical protein